MSFSVYTTNTIDLMRMNEDLILWQKRRYQGKNFVYQCNLTPKSKTDATVTIGYFDRKGDNVGIDFKKKTVHRAAYNEGDLEEDLKEAFGLEPSVIKMMVEEIDELFNLCLAHVLTQGA